MGQITHMVYRTIAQMCITEQLRTGQLTQEQYERTVLAERALESEEPVA